MIMITTPSFSCGSGSCRALVRESGTCSTCQAEVDIDQSKLEIERIKGELAKTQSEDQTDKEKYYQDLRDIWIR